MRLIHDVFVDSPLSRLGYLYATAVGLVWGFVWSTGRVERTIINAAKPRTATMNAIWSFWPVVSSIFMPNIVVVPKKPWRGCRHGPVHGCLLFPFDAIGEQNSRRTGWTRGRFSGSRTWVPFGKLSDHPRQGHLQGSRTEDRHAGCTPKED